MEGGAGLSSILNSVQPSWSSDGAALLLSGGGGKSSILTLKTKCKGTQLWCGSESPPNRGWDDPPFWAPPRLCADESSLHGTQTALKIAAEHSSTATWRGAKKSMSLTTHGFFFIHEGSGNGLFVDKKARLVLSDDFLLFYNLNT